MTESNREKQLVATCCAEPETDRMNRDEAGNCSKILQLTYLDVTLGLMLYYGLLAGVVAAPFYCIMNLNPIESRGTLWTIVAVFGAAVPNFVVARLILCNIRRHYSRDFRICWKGTWSLPLMVCAAVLGAGLALGIDHSIGPLVESRFPMPESLAAHFIRLFNHPAAAVLVAVIIAPVYEELLVRGILLEGLLNRYKPAGAILVSAVIFGAMHMNMPQFVSAGLFGIVVGMLYKRTRSVLLCIAAHMGGNLAGLATYYLSVQESRPELAVAGAAVFAATAVLMAFGIKRLEQLKQSIEGADTQSVEKAG